MSDDFYTHRWSGPPVTRATWDQLVRDVWRIIGFSGVKICNAVGQDAPIINTNTLGINGDASAGEKSDCMFLTRSGGKGHCRTGRRPYDVVVGTILLRAATLIPGFSFTSDGNVYGQDWQPARDLFNKCFPADLNSQGLPGIFASEQATGSVEIGHHRRVVLEQIQAAKRLLAEPLITRADFEADLVSDAEARGFRRAIALLRDSQKAARSSVDRAAMKLAADYLESKVGEHVNAG